MYNIFITTVTPVNYTIEFREHFLLLRIRFPGMLYVTTGKQIKETFVLIDLYLIHRTETRIETAARMNLISTTV
jgi:hypothetical protein